jgi:hypothetical protein
LSALQFKESGMSYTDTLYGSSLRLKILRENHFVATHRNGRATGLTIHAALLRLDKSSVVKFNQQTQNLAE